jgi:hypothetical protein
VIGLDAKRALDGRSIAPGGPPRCAADALFAVAAAEHPP